MPIQSDAEASSVARLLQGGQISGAGRDSALADLRAYDSAKSGPKMVQPVISTEGMPPAEVHPQTTAGKVSDYVRDTAGNAIGLNRAHELAGAVLAPISGLAGIAGAALPGPPGQGANWVQNVQNLARYVPGTRPNEQVQNFQEQVPGAVQATGEAAGLSPANAGAIIPAAQAAAVAIPGGMGLRAGRAAANEAAAATARQATENPNAFQRATSAGFEIAPNDIPRQSGTPIGKVKGSTVQNTTETPADEAARQQRNVTNATTVGAREAGIPEGDTITDEQIAAAKKAKGATRDTIAQSVGSVEDVKPETIQALEDTAAENRPTSAASAAVKRDIPRMVQGLKSGNYSGKQLMTDVQFLRDEGSDASMSAANALEAEMEHQLEGQPEKLADFKQNRTDFAKIYDVEASRTGSRLDPQKLAAREQKPWHPGLTGGLADIADAARHAPNSVRMPNVVLGESTPTSTAGAISTVGKKIVKLVAPNNATPERQAAIAGAAGPPGAVPQIPRPPLQLGNAIGRTGMAPPTQGTFPLPELGPTRPTSDVGRPTPPRGINPPSRGPAGQASANPEAAQTDLTTPGSGRTLNPVTPQEDAVGTPPLGSVLARNSARLPQGQIPPEAGSTVPSRSGGTPADLHPAPGTTARGAGPGMGETEATAGDFVRRKMQEAAARGPQRTGIEAPGENFAGSNVPRLGNSIAGEAPPPPPAPKPAPPPPAPKPAPPPPSPKAKPEGGSPATEALFEEEVKRDADRAHAANAANGGKTKGELKAPKLGDDLAKVQARTAKPRSATRAWGRGPAGSKDAMEAMDRLQQGEPIESIVKDMTSRGYPQEIVDADLRDIKASTERGPAPRGPNGE